LLNDLRFLLENSENADCNKYIWAFIPFFAIENPFFQSLSGLVIDEIKQNI